MYLSRIALDANRRETMKALVSPQLLHGAVEQSFDGSRQRNLWRIDWLGDVCYLLVLSEGQPDLSRIAGQFGYPQAEKPWETKNYDQVLERLQHNQSWQFRLRANPVRSILQDKDADSGRGKVVAHVTQTQQKQWLLARADTHGFMLAEDAFDVVHTQWMKFHKGTEINREITIRTATFEGILIITDVERFKQTLLTGIGREKAYGCGLLTIARNGDGGNA
jgi:CRISPR system Cascade subunit CasE